ncbi:MAG: YIP1 family protein [Anaerolineae bacterium]|nr:YIP1 family protein [Anaerolineae bacterium]
MEEMFGRMKRAVMLDASLYEEVEHDTTLNQEALMIVIAAAIASGIGALIGGIIGGNVGRAFLSALVSVIAGVVSYYIWAYVTLWVGTNFFGGTADAGEMLRVLGYAHTPQLLGLLGFIPCIGWVFSVAGLVLSLIAAVIAIREALDFDTGKAVITAAIGWVIIFVIQFIISSVLGVGAAGLGAIRSRLR